MAKSVTDEAREVEEMLLGASEVDEERLREAFVTAMEPVLDDAVANAPVDEGDLRDNIVLQPLSENEEVDKPDGVKVAVQVGPTETAYYGVMVELGAEQPPQPFLRPAFDANQDKVASILADELDEVLFG